MLDESYIAAFCDICNWTYEVWLNHKKLFDDNPRLKELLSFHAGDELVRIHQISLEYSLLQICKLHDKDCKSIGIHQMLNKGPWNESTQKELSALVSKMDTFACKIKSARDKIIAHNDAKTFEIGATLGAFTEGKDEEYFSTIPDNLFLLSPRATTSWTT